MGQKQRAYKRKKSKKPHIYTIFVDGEPVRDEEGQCTWTKRHPGPDPRFMRQSVREVTK